MNNLTYEEPRNTIWDILIEPLDDVFMENILTKSITMAYALRFVIEDVHTNISIKQKLKSYKF